MSVPYVLQTNAKVERQQASITTSLALLVSKTHTDWEKQLNFALLALHVTNNQSKHFLLTGSDMDHP